MKISYNWLKNYLNLELKIEDVSVLLTDIGLEVEGINEVESIKGGLKGVVIGKVLTKIQHPNADRLNLTTVDVGEANPLKIVCGAPNVSVGQKVPVATVGTVLYDVDQSYKIKKSKIRGEVSEGMICGADEIGLGEKTDGIMELDSNAKVGLNASEHFQLESDTVFDIGLTPNRSDAMGHIGVARDLMTVLNHKGYNLQMCRPSVEGFKISDTTKTINVKVEDTNLCPRYSGVSISGINIADSPKWLQNKLIAIGLSPINNVVDITNYVLHETGQPLHAFDISKIKGNSIFVSTVKDKTKFTTLEDKEIELSSDDLMINNSSEPMCIAGVFGGIKSGVSNQTNNIFLESAYFNPVSVRKTAKRHGFNTDASFRYERGCDPNITVYALKRAALLIIEICGGTISSDITDIYEKKIKHFPVELSYEKMDSLIGETIDREMVKSILKDLEIEIINSDSKGLNLLIPPYRVDVQRDVDVIEEILRIYGYNTINISSGLKSIIPHSDKINADDISNTISDLLSNNGFFETINNSLTNEKYTSLIKDLDINENVKLLNPLSQDLNIMRQSLLFSGLENIAYNQNRKNTNIKFYEFGKTYHKTSAEYREDSHLQLLISGNLQEDNWNTNSDKVDFFFLKEKVEHIIKKLGINDYHSDNTNKYGIEDGLVYFVNNKKLVSFGKIEDDICNRFDIKSNVFAADFNFDLLVELSISNKIKYKNISKFPSVKRDLSLLIDNSISFDQLKEVAKKIDNKILKSINLFDVYEGDKLPEGKKSYAVSFIMSDDSKTLTDKYVDKVMDKLIRSFKDSLGAELR